MNSLRLLRSCLPLLAASCAALLAALPASATIARYLELPEHLAISHLVVRAKVVGSRTFTGDEGRPRTDTELKVLEAFKGKHGAGTSISVRQIRGPQGDGVLQIPGDAVLREGDEVIVFLKTEGKGVYYFTAMGESKWDVIRAAEGDIVRRDLKGLAFYVTGQKGDPVLDAPDEAPVPLELFAATLTELVQAGGDR